MKKMNLLALLIIMIPLLNACEPKQDMDLVIDNKIKQELTSGIDVESVFLGLKFGMTKYQIEYHLDSVSIKNPKKLSKDGTRYSYNFSNENLGNNWDVYTTLHNDSLLKVSLSKSFKNNYILDNTFHAAIKEYTDKYKEPIHSSDRFKYWINNNLEILVFKSDNSDNSDPSVNIVYTNTRRSQKIIFGEFEFDAYGNSNDNWYLKAKESKNKVKPSNDANDI